VKPARQQLDEVQTRAQLDRFDEAAFLAQVRDEGEPRAFLPAIDAFARTCLRIGLAGLSIATPFRNYLTAEALAYQDLEQLRARVLGATDRATADAVVDATHTALALRARLRDGVLAIAKELEPPEAPPPEPQDPPNREELIELD